MKLIVATAKVISDRGAELFKASEYSNINVRTRNPSEEKEQNCTLRLKNPVFFGFLSSIINHNLKIMLEAVKTPLFDQFFAFDTRCPC